MSNSNNISLPIVNVSTCSLNQLGMDFKNNYERIKKSILIAKELGATLRVGPELEVCGYDCQDHFLELDTITMCWNVLGKILNSDLTDNIMCQIGMPVLYKNSRYNCTIMCLNRKILLIRPKIWNITVRMLNEDRYFTGWGYDNLENLEDFNLPQNIIDITEQTTVPFGVAIIETNDLSLASEICVEAITPQKIINSFLLEGVDIVTNSSGWVFTVDRLKFIIESLISPVKVHGGVYIFSNSNGCGGSNILYDGVAFINQSGNFLSATNYLGFKEVEVINAKVNLNEHRTKRANFMPRNFQQNENMLMINRIKVNFNMIESNQSVTIESIPNFLNIDKSNQLILSSARYLWDYLKRLSNKNSGYYLEISHDIYSVVLCVILKRMCHELMEIIKNDNIEKDIILNHIRNISGYKDFIPKNSAEIAKKLIYVSSYKDVSNNFINTIASNFNYKFIETNWKNGMSENMISRLKMINNYNYAESFMKDKPLLVISKINADVANFGNYSKYGEFYGDISPIAGFLNIDIKQSINNSCFNIRENCENILSEDIKQLINKSEEDENISKYMFLKKDQNMGLLSLRGNIKDNSFIKKYYNKFTNNLNKLLSLANPFVGTITNHIKYDYRPITGIEYDENE